MASLSDSVRSHRLFLLGVLPLLLALESDRPWAAVSHESGPERRTLSGGTVPELMLPGDGSLVLSSTETLLPLQDGGMRRVLSLAPVRWQDELGKWHEVDARFGESGTEFVTESDSLSCRFPLSGDDDFRVLTSGGGPELSWTGGALEIHRADGARLTLAAKPQPVTAQPQADGSLLYAGVWPGVSERYSLEPGLVKHEVILERLPFAAPGDELVLSWTLRVDAPASARQRLLGSEPTLQFESDGDGGFRVQGSDGAARLWLPAPYLVEDVEALRVDAASEFPGLPSSTDPAQDAQANPLSLAWRSTPVDGGIRLELRLPMSELMARADAFPLVIDPTIVDLMDAAGVLTVFAADRFDLLGDKRGLAAGDFNGDGHLDLVVGAHRADGLGNARRDAGELHLLFGPLGDGTRDLATDKGDVMIVGADPYDTLGWSVAAGDLNGDGVDDLLIGAPFADGPTNRRSGAGEASVLLGPFAPGELRDLAFHPPDAILHGAARSHGAGYAVAIGDVTGDGIGDAIVSALRSDGPAGDREVAGSIHVMAGPFQRGPARRIVDLARAPADAVIHGASEGDQLGAALAVGDLDGDGRADLAMSSLSSDGRGDARPRSGEVQVLLGPLGPGYGLDLASQSADARVFGAHAGDLLGHALAIGDLSGDGVGDLIAGAHLSDGPDGTRDRAGSIAVFFGPFSSGMDADVLTGGADVLVHGADLTDLAGWSVGVGDLSGDGRDDLLFGAVAADGPAETRSGAGELHALLGPLVSGSVIDLAVSPSDVEVQGAQRSDQLGYSVSVADLTGDGIGDLIGAAKTARGPGESRPAGGETVVVQGRATGCLRDADCDDGLACSVDTCDEFTGECSADEGPCNAPPTCEVGADRLAGCRELELTGVSVDDPDGDALDYIWTSSDPAVAIAPASGHLQAGEGTRPLPVTLVSLAETLPPCGRETILTLRVSDGRGGETSCHLRVRFSDERAPALLGVPSNAIVDCDSVPPPADVAALDGCDSSPQLSMTEVRIDGACPGQYRLERTWRAVDACGNAGEAQQIIEVVDEVGPVVQVGSGPLHHLWPPDHRMVHFTSAEFVPEAEDACSSPVTWRFVDCSSNQPENDTGDGSTEPDCVVDEDGQGFSVRAERAGNRLHQRRYEVTVVATDACGNDGEPTGIGHVAVAHDLGQPRDKSN